MLKAIAIINHNDQSGKRITINVDTETLELFVEDAGEYEIIETPEFNSMDDVIEYTAISWSDHVWDLEWIEEE